MTISFAPGIGKGRSAREYVCGAEIVRARFVCSGGGVGGREVASRVCERLDVKGEMYFFSMFSASGVGDGVSESEEREVEVAEEMFLPSNENRLSFVGES